MFTLSCDHRFCYECIRRNVEDVMRKEGKIAPCPSCPQPILLVETEQLFPDDQNLHALYSEIELRTTLANGNFIDCPTADCKARFEKPPDYQHPHRDSTAAGAGTGKGAGTGTTTAAGRVRATCNECKFCFCSACNERYHYTHECSEIAPITERWHRWLKEDRKKWHKKAATNEKIASKSFAKARKEAEKRFKTLQRDEAWKEANCRKCPHCYRAVNKLSGCDAMICGGDAHGGNTQNGCGKTFMWGATPSMPGLLMPGLQSAYPPALPYKRPYDKARLPKSAAEVDPEHAREVHHYIIDFSAPENAEIPRESARLKCTLCESDVVGPLFSCINCDGWQCCIKCEENLADLHPFPDHVFNIHLEDFGGNREKVGLRVMWDGTTERDTSGDGGHGGGGGGSGGGGGGSGGGGGAATNRGVSGVSSRERCGLAALARMAGKKTPGHAGAFGGHGGHGSHGNGKKRKVGKGTADAAAANRRDAVPVDIIDLTNDDDDDDADDAYAGGGGGGSGSGFLDLTRIDGGGGGGGGGGGAISSIADDEAFARRLQAEEDARSKRRL